MIGHSAISEFAISEFQFIAYVPPPPLVLSGTDGYSEDDRKKYQKLEAKLESAKRARDRALRKAKDDLRELIAKQVNQENDQADEVDVKVVAATPELAPSVAKLARKKLTTKPLVELEANVLDLQAQINQLRYEEWQAQEYRRLVALERRRAHDREDLEALLLLL